MVPACLRTSRACLWPMAWHDLWHSMSRSLPACLRMARGMAWRMTHCMSCDSWHVLCLTHVSMPNGRAMAIRVALAVECLSTQRVHVQSVGHAKQRLAVVSLVSQSNQSVSVR